MPQPIFDSVPALLAPAALASLLGGEITSVTREPFDAEHFSANTLEHVSVVRDGHPALFVLKHFHPELDWVMRLTHDTRVREAMLFRYAMLARLPAACTAPILALAREGTSWATLMYDVSDALSVSSAPVLDPDVVRLWLTHLAALHAAYWQDTSLLDSNLGLSSLSDFMTILAPQTVQRELDVGRAHFVLEAAARGWETFDRTAPTDVVRIVHAVQDDPAPLLTALDQMPHTLVHGDFKAANLGLLRARGTGSPGTQDESGARTVLLDWQDATAGPAFLDVGYLIAVNARRLPFAAEEVIEIYASALQSQGFVFDPHARNLCLVAGGAMRLLWQIAQSAQALDPATRTSARIELDWWYDLLRRTV